MDLKCRRCKKHPAQPPRKICARCAQRPKARRGSRSSSFSSRGGAAGVLLRSTPSFLSANASYYDDRPAATRDSSVGEG